MTKTLAQLTNPDLSLMITSTSLHDHNLDGLSPSSGSSDPDCGYIKQVFGALELSHKCIEGHDAFRKPTAF